MWWPKPAIDRPADRWCSITASAPSRSTSWNSACTRPEASPCSGPDSVVSPASRQAGSDAPVEAAMRATKAELVSSWSASSTMAMRSRSATAAFCCQPSARRWCTGARPGLAPKASASRPTSRCDSACSTGFSRPRVECPTAASPASVVKAAARPGIAAAAEACDPKSAARSAPPQQLRRVFQRGLTGQLDGILVAVVRPPRARTRTARWARSARSRTSRWLPRSRACGRPACAWPGRPGRRRGTGCGGCPPGPALPRPCRGSHRRRAFAASRQAGGMPRPSEASWPWSQRNF